MRIKKDTFVAQVWNGGGIYIRRILRAIGWMKKDTDTMILQFKYLPKYDCLIVKKVEEIKLTEEELRDGIKEEN